MRKQVMMLVLSLLMASPAVAEDCAPYFANIFTNEPVSLRVHAARISIGMEKWISLAMSNNYRNGVSIMSDNNDHFIARTTGAGLYDIIQGPFTELLSDRQGIRRPILELRQAVSGRIVRNDGAGITYTPLVDMDCYRINDNTRQFALSANTQASGATYTKWLFSLERL